MTLSDFSKWKGNISINELESLLKQKKKIERKLSRLMNAYYDIEDSMSVFNSGDEMYKSLDNNRVHTLKQVNFLRSELDKIKQQIEEA